MGGLNWRDHALVVGWQRNQHDLLPFRIIADVMNGTCTDLHDTLHLKPCEWLLDSKAFWRSC